MAVLLTGREAAFPHEYGATIHGMDIRTWLVGQVLAGTAGASLPDELPLEQMPAVIADAAVMIADAVLWRLNNSSKGLETEKGGE